VKTTDTAETARALAKVLSKDAIIVSMQNGVITRTNRSRIWLESIARRGLRRCFRSCSWNCKNTSGAAIWFSVHKTK